MRPLQQRLFKIYSDRERQQHRLRYLFLELTRRCNLNCRHCGSDCSKDSNMREMTTESWHSVIKYMQSHYKPAFVITGGEPLVRGDLFEITSCLKKNNAQWGMVTNGFALTEEKLKNLCADGIDSITLSVDGPEESHLYIRRHPKSYEKVVKAMDLISKEDIVFKDVVTCVYPGNLNKLKETAELILSHGMNSWRLFRIFPKGKAAKNEGLILNFDQSNALVKWIEENRVEYKKRGLNISFSCEGYLSWKQDRLVREMPFFCRSGINYASILSDGTVTGCNNNGPAFYQGNIAKRDFDDIWENEFSIYRDPLWRKTGICKNCKEWNYCLGNSVHLRDSKKDSGPGFCYLFSDDSKS